MRLEWDARRESAHSSHIDAFGFSSSRRRALPKREEAPMRLFSLPSLLALVLLAGTLLFVMNANAADATATGSVRVRIETGTVEGLRAHADGVDRFLGIPFARPPVGELRWQAPQPVEPWEGVRPVKAFGPQPMQAPVYGDMRFRSAGMSEDCLYLNVWAPTERGAEPLPVLLYFYGGGFIAGDGSEPRYDGASMARRGMIAVTCNYRLNVFGFFAHAELGAENAHGASGNYGYLDQNAALRWVRRNIAAFGGDPEHITIAGESAGSISVSAHMASPLSRDLIAGAIGESGAAIEPTFHPVPQAAGEQAGAAFLAAIGCDSVAAARAIDADSLLQAYVEAGSKRFPTIVDGHFLPQTPLEIFRAGEQAQVPLLVGWNSAEIPGQAFMVGRPYTPDDFVARVREVYPENSDSVLAVYPHATADEVERSATDLAADRFIVHATWKWSDLHARGSDQPVFRYLYDKLRPPLKDPELTPGLAGGTQKGGPPPPPPIGAPHACEIEYCLGNLDLVEEYAWTADDHAVSAQAQTFFANFIKTGDPNGAGLPAWPAIKGTETTPAVMVIDVESAAAPARNDARFGVLDRAYGSE